LCRFRFYFVISLLLNCLYNHICKMENAIEIVGVSKTFVNGDVSFDAIHNLACAFSSSGLFFVVGKSGSGKSTLLNLVGGLETPTSGKIVINPSLRFCYVFQDENFIFSLSILENLQLVCNDGQLIDSLLKKVGLFDKKATPIMSMSKGERARLAIAKSLLSGASVLLLDEPTGNLDSANGQTVFSLLREVSKDHLVIVVSHDQESADKYGDVVLRLEDGKLVGEAVRRPISTGKRIITKQEATHHIPPRIGWHYVLHKAFSRKGKVILSLTNLVLSSSLLMVSLTLLFQNRVEMFSRAFEKSENNSLSISNTESSRNMNLPAKGIDFYKEICSYGAVEPIVAAPYSSVSSKDFFLFAYENQLTNKTWPDLEDNEIAVSSHFSKPGESNPIGKIITLDSGITLTVAAIYDDIPSPFARPFPSSSNDFIFTNEKTFGRIHSDSQWFDGPNPIFRNEALAYYRGCSSDLVLKEGRLPTAANEIVVSSLFVNSGWPQGDSSLVLEHSFPVQSDPRAVDPIDRVFTSLTVVGISENEDPQTIRFGNEFYEQASDILNKDASYFVSYEDAGKLLPLLFQDRISFLAFSDADQNTLVGYRQLLSFIDLTAPAWIATSVIFCVMTLIFVLLYSLDNIKTNEKDIALLKLARKSDGAILLLFGSMNSFLSLLAFPLTCLLGVGGAYGLGLLANKLFDLTPNIFVISWQGALISLAVLIIIPFLVTLLVLPKIKTRDAAQIFKRNLV